MHKKKTKEVILIKKSAFWLFLSLLFFYKTANAELFKAEEFFLNNGLRVAVIENHKAPLIKQMVWYNVGAIDDGLGKGGRAHFLEHLMFRGTDKIADGEFNNLMENNGVSDNAFTGYEVTAYHEFADISKLELLMALEADRMNGLNFDEKAFEVEKNVVIQERKQVVENNPSSEFYERLRLITWGNLPFGRPVTGLTEEIEALSYDDVKEFYKKHYKPNNAILVLAGDIDVAAAKTLAQKYFGNIQGSPSEKRNVPVLKEKFNERLEMSLPHIQTPKITKQYVLPPFAELKGFVYDYDALAQYLGEGRTSALYRELVVEQKKALSVSADFTFVSRANAIFSISMVPAEGVSIEEAETSLNEALNKALKNLNERKIASVKKKMLADLVYVRDNPATSANTIGYLLTTGFSLDFIQNYETDVAKVSLAGVKNAYAEVFGNSALVTGVLLPESEEKN